MVPLAEVGFEEPFTGINGAIDSLLMPPAKCDAVFALYLTAARMGEGLDFLKVPGVVGHLGVVAPASWLAKRGSSAHDVARTVWLGLTGATRNAEVVKPPAVVIPREVGHTYLRSACEYDPGPMLDMVEGVAWEPTELAVSYLAKRRESSDGNMIFVAEWGICERVCQQLNDAAVLPDLLKRAGSRSEEPFATVPFSSDFTPRFPTGVAVRADAPLWLTRLRIALDEELLGNAIHRTVAWYVELLKVQGDLVPAGHELEHWAPLLCFEPEASAREKRLHELVYGEAGPVLQKLVRPKL